jgi:hypothetical protein
MTRRDEPNIGPDAAPTSTTRSSPPAGATKTVTHKAETQRMEAIKSPSRRRMRGGLDLAMSRAGDSSA